MKKPKRYQILQYGMEIMSTRFKLLAQSIVSYQQDVNHIEGLTIIDRKKNQEVKP